MEAFLKIKSVGIKLTTKIGRKFLYVKNLRYFSIKKQRATAGEKLIASVLRIKT